MKEWREVTFTTEWVKALLVAVILAPADLVSLVYFPRYRSLKIANRSTQISNSKILPLLKA